MSEKLPVREDLFDETDGGRLLANQCKACRRIYFPKADICFECLEPEMENIKLSRHGTLYAHTIGRLPSTHFQPPYAIGLIDLPEGIRVFAPLKMMPDKTYTVGMQMEIFIDELWKEEDKQVMGYKFKPALT